MTEKCNCLEEIQKKWPEPFEKPIMFNRDDASLKVSDWAVKVYALNPSGTIKRGSLQHLMLNFCPICGCNLAKEKA